MPYKEKNLYIYIFFLTNIGYRLANYISVLITPKLIKNHKIHILISQQPLNNKF
jgi:hypothetical protein